MRTPAADALPVHLAAYLEHLRVRGYSPHTVRQAADVLPRVIGRLGRNATRGVRRIREEDVVRYARALGREKSEQGRPFSLSSQRTYLKVLRRFFAFLEAKGILLRNPVRDVVLPKVTTLPRRVPSPAQVRRLMNVPITGAPLGQRDAAILELLYGTGIRVGECAGASIGDVDLQAGTLLVRNGKGKRDRLVPIPGRAAKALDLYLREGRPLLLKEPREPALFCSYGGRLRIQTQAIEVFVRKYAREAKLGFALSPHSLRHACATHLLRNGASIRHVQRLLGHRDLSSTERYTRVEVQDLRSMIEARHPRERQRRGRMTAWRKRYRTHSP